MSGEMNITQWHVPIDDHSCYWHAIFTSFGKPVNKELMRKQRLELYKLPEYAPRKNRRNNYGYDPAEQRSHTYTGMGMDINVHDQWAVESMGPIQDRAIEHLAKSDRAIVQYRKMLQAAISSVEAGNGGDLPLAIDEERAVSITGPVAIDTIARTADWRTAWLESDFERRSRCNWRTAH